MQLTSPYLLFLGSAKNRADAKTAVGISEWRPDKAIGEYALPECEVSVGLPKMGLEEAASKGVKTLLIGVANSGGYIPDSWIETIRKAITLGMDIANPMHTRLQAIHGIVDLAKTHGVALFNAREYTDHLPIGTGKKRSGKRLLTVGTDCSVGKMYSTLALEKSLKTKGKNCTFRATGQTGILIEGSGIPIDAIISDFIAGAVEKLAPANDDSHLDLIEGQGSLHHPAYAGVTMGLIHGSQPDYLVICHDPSRPHMRHLPDYELPSLSDCIRRNIEAAQLTNPNVAAIGICLNTFAMTEVEALEAIAKAERETGLPATDPIRFSVDKIIAAL
jgi:uncharacterized NAD-dependent epimerase/dehydratase family protein